MTQFGTFSRGTPGSRPALARTPALAGHAVGRENDGPELVARALADLVIQLDRVGVSIADWEAPAMAEVRAALRKLTAGSRESELRLKVDDVGDALGDLRRKMLERGVASITIHDSAAPGELLTLARWLCRGLVVASPVAPADAESGGTSSATAIATARLTPAATPRAATPSSNLATAVELGERELLRTWSVLVLPSNPPTLPDRASGIVANTVARLSAARGQEGTRTAVGSLLDSLAEAESRGDGLTVEGIARGCLAQIRTIGTGAGRAALELAIRRLLDSRSLELLAQRLPQTADVGAMISLLSRAGDAAVETLLRHLHEARDATARRAYFDAIVAMDVGASILFEGLSDDRWFVVRNASALLGEMHAGHADNALIPLLSHHDERIRIAAGRGLIRLRTPLALTALHRVIDDSNPEVRRISAGAYGLAGSMPDRAHPATGLLTNALDRETDDNVALEMLAALGRLGSSGAVQRLLRMVAPVGTSSGARPSDRYTTSSGSHTTEYATSRQTGEHSVAGPGGSTTLHSSWLRIAALEALVQARGHAVAPMVERLRTDGDPEVAAAAARIARGI